MVHVELAYGVWSYPLHDSAAAGVVAGRRSPACTSLMYFAAASWWARPARPWIPDNSN